MKEIIKNFLDEHKNIEKAKFDSKIIKTKLPVLGIKTSDLDSFAKLLARENVGLDEFDFSCHEEVVLAGMMIGYKKCKAEEKIDLLEKLYPFFDNWAVVDSIVPRLKGLEGERTYFEGLLEKEQEFIKRTGIIFLMKYVLPSDLKNVVLFLKNYICKLYYVNMAISWCYSEAFIRDYVFMKKFICEIDDRFVRNKSIQKACESFRLTDEQKKQIKLLKI